MKIFSLFLVNWLCLLGGLVTATEPLPFYDRTVYVQEGQRAGRSFTGMLVKKQTDIYLVVCKHSIDPKINHWLVSLPNQKYQTQTLYAEWTNHPKADLCVVANPVLELAKDSWDSYTINFEQLAELVPSKLTPVVVSGYPNRLVTEPFVSPVVRQTSVSSIETLSKSQGGDVIPVFFLNHFSGSGASGSPVFDYRVPKVVDPQCVGILAGGWNNNSNTGSVVTPAYYLRELIELVENQKEKSK